MIHHALYLVNETSDDILLEKIWPEVDRGLFNHNVTQLPALSKEEKVFICKIYLIGHEAGYNDVIDKFNELIKSYYKG